MKKISLLIAIGLLTFSCSKNESPDPPEANGPKINSFSPTSGAVGTDIWITGQNFGSTDAANVVKIGNVTAPISSSSTSEIFITVPEGATTGTISVTVDGKTDTAGTFTVTESSNNTSITLNKNNLELYTNNTETVEATVTGEGSSNSVIWSSNDETVAIVDSNGKITAIGSGSTVITASVDGVEDTCTVTIKPNIYVVGFEEEGGTDVVKTWINQIGEELMDAGNASSIFVNGTDVYVAGQNGNGQAATWKNGEPSVLATGTNNSAEARSIYVAGNDVYAVGHDDNGDTDTAYLWKNGDVLHELTDGTTSARAHSIFIDGTDNYVAGNEYNDLVKQVGKIWKNGTVLYELTNENNNGDARSVYVGNNTVYAVGQEQVGEQYFAKIWANGVGTNLTNGDNYADARSVFVVGTDVYVLGYESTLNGETIIVWKNNQILYTLTDGSNLADGHSLFIDGTDVYAAGYRTLSGDTLATVWKNGEVLYDLNNGSSLARAYSIFVK